MSLSVSLITTATVFLIACQALLLEIDERVFHRLRGLGPWERWGHPIDTLSVLAPVALAATTSPTPATLILFAILATLSCLCVTKDEAVHTHACGAMEHWLHALLFLLHAPVLIGVGLVWWLGGSPHLIGFYATALALVASAQFLQAFRLSKGRSMSKRPVNNAFYSELGERWYTDDTHAVALLRREADVKLAYIRDLCTAKGWSRARILDLGAGAGLLANPLAAMGHHVTAVDNSQPSLEVAARHAPADNPPRFLCRDVGQLTDGLGSFDVVLLLDFLEHVEDPEGILKIAARFLAPGGVLVFHTFNRTPVAWLLAIKALEVFTRDCPHDVHVYHLFIKPKELTGMLNRMGLEVEALQGIRPIINRALLWSGLSRRLHPAMQFKLTRLKGAGYIGHTVPARNGV